MVKFAALLTTLSFTGPPSLPHCIAHEVTNHWFPLKAGSVYYYRGERNNRAVRDTFMVTHRHQMVDGIRTIVILDRAWIKNRLIERTHDYYTQDCKGNVWYLGENTKEFPSGSTEGSWIAGKHGARGGIFMPHDPKVGDSGWQEYWKGHAEDQYKVLSVSKDTLLTKETSPLEPGVVDHKYYKAGIGETREISVKGDNERLHLVRKEEF